MSAVPFVRRHVGPSPEDIEEMASAVERNPSTISSTRRFRKASVCEPRSTCLQRGLKRLRFAICAK